jgi:hypothetical protein
MFQELIIICKHFECSFSLCLFLFEKSIYFHIPLVETSQLVLTMTPTSNTI